MLQATSRGLFFLEKKEKKNKISVSPYMHELLFKDGTDIF